jgi:hypothetical protein
MRHSGWRHHTGEGKMGAKQGRVVVLLGRQREDWRCWSDREIGGAASGKPGAVLDQSLSIG